MNEIQTKFWRSEARMRAAEVPAADRGTTVEPVTVEGWYEETTCSGQQAWVLITWGGRTHDPREVHVSYDPKHYKRCEELIALGADPFARDPSETEVRS